MASREDLIGIWSADALDPPGSISDEVLVFNSDGTGYQEYISGGPCYALLFRWAVTPNDCLRLKGERELFLADGDSVSSRGSSLDVTLSFRVALEDAAYRRRRTARVLRLEHPINNFAGRFSSRFAFVREDAWMLEQPELIRAQRIREAALPDPALAVPGPSERQWMRDRFHEDYFVSWSELQRAIYLGVLRGHNTLAALVNYLGVDRNHVETGLHSLFGPLVWENTSPRLRPDQEIGLSWA